MRYVGEALLSEHLELSGILESALVRRSSTLARVVLLARVALLLAIGFALQCSDSGVEIIVVLAKHPVVALLWANGTA